MAPCSQCCAYGSWPAWLHSAAVARGPLTGVDALPFRWPALRDLNTAKGGCGMLQSWLCIVYISSMTAPVVRLLVSCHVQANSLSHSHSHWKKAHCTGISRSAYNSILRPFIALHNMSSCNPMCKLLRSERTTGLRAVELLLAAQYLSISRGLNRCFPALAKRCSSQLYEEHDTGSSYA